MALMAGLGRRPEPGGRLYRGHMYRGSAGLEAFSLDGGSGFFNAHRISRWVELLLLVHPYITGYSSQ